MMCKNINKISTQVFNQSLQVALPPGLTHLDSALELKRAMAVVGAGMGLTVIDGRGNTQPVLLTISSGGVRVNGITFQNANSTATTESPIMVHGGSMNGGSMPGDSHQPVEFIGVELRDLVAPTGSLLLLSGHILLDHCMFRNNTAERGAHGGHQLEWSGGAVFNNKGVVSVSDSVFENNRALVQGGAIFNNQVSE